VDLASALVARGHEVHVISYATPFRLSSDTRVHFHLVDVPAYPLFKYPPYAMALASKLAEVAVAHDLDILHAHYAVPHSMAALLAREMAGRSGLKVVTTLHGTDITLVGSDPSYRPATSFAISHSNRVTAVSEFLVDQTKQFLCADCDISVIPNFIDTERYAPGRAEEACSDLVGEGEFLLCHTSNFRPVKRVLDVIRVFHEVGQRMPTRLAMVGDGPERLAAENLCRELGISERVTFTGLLPDALPILQRSDAFLLPSDGESFGLAALEAMACGVPVVGSLAGGLQEVVRDGEEGILAPVGAVELMASRLSELLADEKHRVRLAGNARERACGLYDVNRIVPLYEEAYLGVL
jgi:N-acetyl-alpha-D-glucosaminyl L-malate synthase BshA